MNQMLYNISVNRARARKRKKQKLKTAVAKNHICRKKWRVKGRMLYVGIDLGTSAVKLLLMDGEGKIHKIVSKEYPLYFPHPGWSEQKPEDWYEQTMAGLKELLSEFPAKSIS